MATQAEIEAAAKAIYESEFRSKLFEGFPFEGESDEVKGGYIQSAKAALEAAERVRRM